MQTIIYQASGVIVCSMDTTEERARAYAERRGFLFMPFVPEMDEENPGPTIFETLDSTHRVENGVLVKLVV